MKLTIGQRITVLIAGAALGLLAILGLTWQQIGRVYEATNFANVNTLPSWRDLAVASDALADMRTLLWESSFRSEEPERASLLNDLEARQQ